MPTVYWFPLFERQIHYRAAESLMNIAAWNHDLGYKRIWVPPARCDIARNLGVMAFREQSPDPHPDDVLVMLDIDHAHPFNIVQKVAEHPHEIGVCGALYYTRVDPDRPSKIYPCILTFDEKYGVPISVENWTPGELVKCAFVGPAAMAIKRWVFEELIAKEIYPPFFRYEYADQNKEMPHEDVYWAASCDMAGIPHYCDTSIETPHITWGYIDSKTYETQKGK